MSKYDHYARELDVAFKAARAEYQEAASRLEAAKQEKSAAWEWFEEKYVGERGIRRQRADMELKVAQAEFDAAKQRIWPSFNNRRDELTRELAAEIKRDSLATPDAIDHDGLKLLESGVLNADDVANLAERYKTNPTMLKFVAKTANEMAAATDERADRTKLIAVAMNVSNGGSPVMQAWDDIVTLTKHCSGQNGNRPFVSPEFVLNMAGHWEELSAAAIESF